MLYHFFLWQTGLIWGFVVWLDVETMFFKFSFTRVCISFVTGNFSIWLWPPPLGLKQDLFVRKIEDKNGNLLEHWTKYRRNNEFIIEATAARLSKSKWKWKKKLKEIQIIQIEEHGTKWGKHSTSSIIKLNSFICRSQ